MTSSGSGSTRWLQVGGILATLGGGSAFTYLLFIRESDETGDFWTWPGWLAVVVLTLGTLATAIGFFHRGAAGDSPDRHAPRSQTQHGGKASTNLQAGRDIVNPRWNEKS